MKIEFWFEFASTYSYPAAMRIEQLAKSHRVELVWRPFLLGPLFKQQGWNDSPFNVYSAKGEYMWKDLARECQALGLPFQRPSVFPRNSLLAARIAVRYASQPWIAEFIKSVYQANFRDDLDISDAQVLTKRLPASAGEPEKILDAARHQATKSLLKETTDEAYNKGIFGAPSFYVNSELFWGNDRLEKALQFASISATNSFSV